MREQLSAGLMTEIDDQKASGMLFASREAERKPAER